MSSIKYFQRLPGQINKQNLVIIQLIIDLWKLIIINKESYTIITLILVQNACQLIKIQLAWIISIMYSYIRQWTLKYSHVSTSCWPLLRVLFYTIYVIIRMHDIYFVDSKNTFTFLYTLFFTFHSNVWRAVPKFLFLLFDFTTV